jgi:hypothetical protein
MALNSSLRQQKVEAIRSQGGAGGFTRSESGTGLTTSAQRAEADLLSKDKQFDILQSGGFAARDALRQRTNEAVQQQKRIKRTTNQAFRQANRRGDKAGALDILLKAREANINFGGIQAAGRDREEVLQRSGEQFITEMAKQGQASPAQAQAVQTATPGLDAQKAQGIGGDILDDNKVDADLKGKAFDPASGVADTPTEFGDQLRGDPAGFEPEAVQAGRPFFEGTPTTADKVGSLDRLCQRGSSRSSDSTEAGPVFSGQDPIEREALTPAVVAEGEKDAQDFLEVFRSNHEQGVTEGTAKQFEEQLFRDLTRKHGYGKAAIKRRTFRHLVKKVGFKEAVKKSRDAAFTAESFNL